MEEKVHRRLYAIMDYAVEVGALRQNPLPRRRARKSLAKHFPAVVDLPGVGAILRSAAAADPCKGINGRICYWPTRGNGCPRSPARCRAEFDLDAGNWIVPRARMKKKDEDRGPHVVPLPPRLLNMLRESKRADAGTSPFVCPAPRDAKKSVTPEACEKHYRDALGLGGKHSPHSPALGVQHRVPGSGQGPRRHRGAA